MRRFLQIGIILLSASVGSTLVAQPSQATYTVTFTSTWSAATHPVDFPTNPHFSGLVGATHNNTVSFWNTGGLASAGIESMAETGSKTLLINEMSASADVEYILSGNSIPTSPGEVTLTFDISSDFPLVTLVSMLAPSPDWFVGTSGFNLYDGNAWGGIKNR